MSVSVLALYSIGIRVSCAQTTTNIMRNKIIICISIQIHIVSSVHSTSNSINNISISVSMTINTSSSISIKKGKY